MARLLAFALWLVLASTATSQLLPRPISTGFQWPTYNSATGDVTGPSGTNKSLSECSACRWHYHMDELSQDPPKFYPCMGTRGPVFKLGGEFPFVSFSDNLECARGDGSGKVTVQTLACWNTWPVQLTKVKGIELEFHASLYEQCLNPVCCNSCDGMAAGPQPPVMQINTVYANGATLPSDQIQAGLKTYAATVVTTDITNTDCTQVVAEALYPSQSVNGIGLLTYGFVTAANQLSGTQGTHSIILPWGGIDADAVREKINAQPLLRKITTKVRWFNYRTMALEDHLRFALWPIDATTATGPVSYHNAAARCTADYFMTTNGAPNTAALGYNPLTKANLVSPCLNGGELTLSGLCRCHWPWAGRLCQNHLPTGFDPLHTNCSHYNPCTGRGACNTVTSVLDGKPISYTKCNCTASWFGSEAAIDTDYTGEVDVYAHDLAFCNPVYKGTVATADPQAFTPFVLYNGVGKWDDYETPAMYLLTNQCMMYRGPEPATNWITDSDFPLVPIAPYECFSNLTDKSRTTADTSIPGGYRFFPAANGIRYAGSECVPAGNFSDANADCNATFDQPHVVSCSCHDNYDETEGCWTPVCPWSPTNLTLGACMSKAGQGTCQGKLDTGAVPGYLGACKCNEGWTGIDCNTRLCAVNKQFADNRTWAPNGQLCSGPAQGRCNSTDVATAVCICAFGWEGADCSIRSCVKSELNNEECGGIMFAYNNETSHTQLRSVCNHDPDNPVCECWRSVCNPGNSHWTTFYQNSALRSRVFASDCLCPTDGCVAPDCCGSEGQGCADCRGYQRPDGRGIDFCKCYVELGDPLQVSGFPTIPPQTPPSLAFATYGPACSQRYEDQCNTSTTPCGGNGLCFSLNGLKSNTPPQCFCESNQYRPSTRCTQLTCNVGSNPLITSGDGCALPGASFVTGTCSGTNGQCVCDNTRADMYEIGPDLSCDQPAAGCTSLIPGQTNRYAVCSNVGKCLNGGTPSAQCVCPPGLYTGTYCETPVNCPRFCSTVGSKCYGGGTTSCLCFDNYSGGNCTINACTFTGGTATTPNQCICPAKSIATKSIFKNANACRKSCPVDPVTGIECGFSKDYSGTFLCANLTIYANSTQNATCSCTGRLIADPFHTGEFLALTRNSVTGVCEPICQNGATDPNWDGSHCTCDTSKRWTGTRCNVDRCSNNGRYDPLLQGCVCNSRLFNKTTNCRYPPHQAGDSLCCATTICPPRGAYEGGPYCSCTAPLWTIDQSTGGCKSACVHGTANSVTGACTCAPRATGVLCNISLCDASKGGLALPGYTSCYCQYPQWGGPYCNVSQCKNGGMPLAAPASGCSCVNSYYNGTHCGQDICAQYNGVNNGLTGTQAGCTCNPGWGKTTITDNFAPKGYKVCAVNLCQPSFVPTWCNATNPCKFNSIGYTCKCGLAATFQSPDEGCVPKSCGNGGFSFDPVLVSKCVCAPGWTGAACNQRLCPGGSNHQTVSGNCTCTGNYELSDDGQSCIPIVFSCVNGVMNSDTNTCVCNSGYGNLINVYNASYPKSFATTYTPSCVRTCVAQGTASVDSDGDCVCRSNYYGTNCDTPIAASVLSEVRSSSVLSAGGIAGVTVGAAVFVAGLATALYFYNKKKPIKLGVSARPRLNTNRVRLNIAKAHSARAHAS